MEKLTKKQPINTLKDGDLVDDIFVVKIKKNVSQYAKGYSISLFLSDASGRSVEYKYWGGQDENKVKELFSSIKQDSVVLIRGKASIYREKMQITSNEENPLKVLNPEEYKAEFIMSPKKDIEEMYFALLSKIGSVHHKSLKKLLSNVFKNGLKDKFKKHPGAIEIHHNWISGLLQHTLEVVEYCETAAKLNPELNKDLLLTGALLHDIGKLEEIEVTSRIKGSRKGQFMGHLALGIAFLAEKLKESEIDELMKDKLLHLMTSHHGKAEFGSPKEPMLPEALALYYADEASSKISEMVEFIKEHKEATEDDFMYHYRNKKNIFLK